MTSSPRSWPRYVLFALSSERCKMTEDERSAVFTVTADRLKAQLFRIEGKEPPADVLLELLAVASAACFVRATWQADRINRLEQRCADLETALAKRDTPSNGKKAKR